jgi:hypothetical protein
MFRTCNVFEPRDTIFEMMDTGKSGALLKTNTCYSTMAATEKELKHTMNRFLHEMKAGEIQEAMATNVDHVRPVR